MSQYPEWFYFLRHTGIIWGEGKKMKFNLGVQSYTKCKYLVSKLQKMKTIKAAETLKSMKHRKKSLLNVKIQFQPIH